MFAEGKKLKAFRIILSIYLERLVSIDKVTFLDGIIIAIVMNTS